MVLSRDAETSLFVLSGAVTDNRPQTLAKWASNVLTRLPFLPSQTKMYFLTPAHRNSFRLEKRHSPIRELAFGILRMPTKGMQGSTACCFLRGTALQTCHYLQVFSTFTATGIFNSPLVNHHLQQ